MNRRSCAVTPERRPRILILGPRLDSVSGVSTHLTQLFGSEIASQFELSNLEVGRERSGETRFGTTRRLLLSFFSLAAALSLKRPDVVHINATFDSRSLPRDAVYLAVSRGFARKVVFQVHGGELPRDLCRDSAIAGRLIRTVLRASHAVVLLGQTQMAAFSEFAPAAKFHVIPNAVDVGVVNPSQRGLPGPLNLVFVGRLTKEKGVHECVEVAHLLDRSGRQFTMKIAGSGPEQTALEAHINDLNLGGRVELVGPVFGTQKHKLWHESQILVLPSYTREGLPYALLEGMAAGVVPITTAVGATPEVVADGIHGFFVPARDPQALFDTIAKLDDDRGMLLEMSSRAHSRIREGYTIDRMTGAFAHLYLSLASGARTSHTCWITKVIESAVTQARMTFSQLRNRRWTSHQK